MTGYVRPGSLEEALAIRARSDVMPIAGGTDVYPAKVSRAGWGDMTHRDVLDISAIAGLRGISQTGGHWRIGALATWTEIAEERLERHAARKLGVVVAADAVAVQ